MYKSGAICGIIPQSLGSDSVLLLVWLKRNRAGKARADKVEIASRQAAESFLQSSVETSGGDEALAHAVLLRKQPLQLVFFVVAKWTDFRLGEIISSQLGRLTCDLSSFPA